MSTGCTCAPDERRWTSAPNCLVCHQRILESQLTPYLLTILCGGTGLVLWRNNIGYNAERRVRYGVGGPGGGDYIGLYRGRYVEIELKTATGSQSREQADRERLVTKLGGIYAVVRNASDARALLARLAACSS